ncbi:hypothetical protein [Sphaerisporangium dianthi]|uniref:Uncharacterized protein n=1 Tax=Sphaerisporangium dianthi TaxID=1436120 RepID=A0ABV9CGG4_9ACTN
MQSPHPNRRRPPQATGAAAGFDTGHLSRCGVPENLDRRPSGGS